MFANEQFGGHGAQSIALETLKSGPKSCFSALAQF
jgi:hypothetical protein